MNVKQESYTVQPHWMISDYHLKGTELDVYCLIWGFTQDEQGCYYGSIKYIADYYEIDTRTVERTLKALEAKGLLRKMAGACQRRNGKPLYCPAPRS